MVTSSPTPAVLPDARAREVLVEKLREVAALEDRNMKRHAHAIRTFATEAADYLATPPASDAAVPAGFVLVPVDPTQAMTDAFYDAASDLSGEHVMATQCWAAMLDAAPKVASDTGAGLTGVERMARLWAWHQFGLKWEHLEKVSQAELLAACQAAFDWLNQPLSARQAALATPTDATDGATGGGEVRESDGTALGEVQCHCSEDDGIPDVGVSLGLGNGKALWIGETLLRDGANCGMVFHDGNKRIVAPFADGTDWQEAADILRHHVGPALTAATTPGGDLLEQAAMREAIEAYLAAFDAGTGTVYVEPLMRNALKPAGDGGEA